MKTRKQRRAARKRRTIHPVHRDGGCFINVDASYRDGLAGLAYESALIGYARKVVSAATSVDAETKAMLWAMAVAEGEGLEVVTFRTDCQAVARHTAASPIAEILADHPGWNIQQVPRRANVQPNIGARRALREVGL